MSSPIALKPKSSARDAGERIVLPTEPPPIPRNDVKPHHSPYTVGSSTNRATPKQLSKPSRPSNPPTRLANETFPSIPERDFYENTGSTTSKHFPPAVRDATNPTSFLSRSNAYQARAPYDSDADSPPPEPKRMPDLPRHTVVYKKKNRPTAPPNEPIDLVSESEEEEAGSQTAGPSKVAKPLNGSAAERVHPASSGQMTSSSHARQSSPPSHRDAKTRHRHQEFRSSSTESQIGKPDSEDPIEDYADDNRKHHARMGILEPDVRLRPKQMRAPMQNKNGVVPAPTEVRRNVTHHASKLKLIGEVTDYVVDKTNCWTKPLSLSLRSDALLYGQKAFPLSDMTFLFISTDLQVERLIGFVFQAAHHGSRFETHLFWLETDRSGATDAAIRILVNKAKQVSVQQEWVKKSNLSSILYGKRDELSEASRETPRTDIQRRLDFSHHSTRDESTSRSITRTDGMTSRPQPAATRRSGRTSVVEQRADREMMAEQIARRPQNPDKVLCRWPPTGRQELAITVADYFRLYGDEFLNDTLIDFGLRYVVEDQLGKRSKPEPSVDTPTNPLDALRPEDVHVFNPFFYKKLATKVKVNRPANSASIEPYPDWPAYDSVRKWTNKVDIFQKKFLIVPVNENLHWYMAVIYNPGVVLEDPRFLRGSTPIIEPIRPTTRRAGRHEEEQNIAMVQDSLAESNSLATDGVDELQRELVSTPMLCDIGSMADTNSKELAPDSQMLDLEAPSAQVRTHSDSTPIEVMDNSFVEAAPAAPVSQKQSEADAAGEAMAVDHVEEATSPTDTIRSGADLSQKGLIMTFDSLSATHGAVSNVLNRWLAYEARDKKDGIELSWRDRQKPLPYKSVVVPSQRNFSDCGIYCLHNMEVLLSQPHEMMSFIYKSTLKKEELDGEKLDHMAQWQGDVALDGRAKWRSIIDSLSDEPIGASESATGPNQDELMKASQASSVEMHSTTSAPAEPLPTNPPPGNDPRDPNSFRMGIQAKFSQPMGPARVEVLQTTGGAQPIQKASEEPSTSLVSSTVATHGSNDTGPANSLVEEIELEDHGDMKTDDMDDASSNTAEIGLAVPLSAPDGQLRLPDTEGYDEDISEEEEILVFQPDDHQRAKMREQWSAKKSRVGQDQTVPSMQGEGPRTGSSYGRRELRSNGQSATTAKPHREITTMSPIVQEIMDPLPERPVRQHSPKTGSKRKPDTIGATSPQTSSRPTPKRRRQRNGGGGSHQDEAIHVED